MCPFLESIVSFVILLHLFEIQYSLVKIATFPFCGKFLSWNDLSAHCSADASDFPPQDLYFFIIWRAFKVFN